MCLQGFWPELLQKMELLSTEVGKLLMERRCKEEGRSVQFGVCYSDSQMGKSGQLESGVQEKGLGRRHDSGVVSIYHLYYR